MNAAPLFIRTIAGRRTGSGHAMRCLALAQAWRRSGGICRFLVNAEARAFLNARLPRRCTAVTVAAATGSDADAAFCGRLAARARAACVVVDGYDFGPRFQRRLKRTAPRTLVVDDNGDRAAYAADWVLNQNVHASRRFYGRKLDGSRLLAGPRYALLRPEFRRTARRRHPMRATRLLVLMGGSDPVDATRKVIDALALSRTPGLRAVVVVGTLNRRLPELRERARRLGVRAEFESNCRRISARMARAHFCVSAAGSTVWELLRMGVPTVLLPIAGNQVRIARDLHRRRLAMNLGWHARVSAVALARAIDRLAASPARRRAISERGRLLVDGRGADRVVRIIRGGGR
jgi:UDP-2,4-diacetamido-2,4,6-trideoxy-beta-L-altropyranose hydrolase